MARAYQNPVKTKLAAGEAVLGMSVRMVRSADVARLAKTTGHDFLFIDIQHSIFSAETIFAIAQTAIEIGVSPMVRVRSIDDPDVSLMLDNCVQGIIYPDINTAEQAQHAVDVCKFAPLGKRSVTGGYPMFDYAAMPLSDSIPLLNDTTLVGVMIETVEGLENVEAIAAVPGVDVVHVGTNDLLVDMGLAGKFDAPEIIAAQDRVNQACAQAGIVSGCGGNRSIERQARAVKNGARFLTTQTDIAFLTSAANAWTTGLRDAIAKG
ncbi:MAG: aldolase/citrate lyase family protein [Roseicyclus sp.]